MPTELNNDVLYFNNVTFGNPLSKVMLGFFAITKTDVVFIPRHTQERTSEGTFDVQHYMHTTDVFSYEDMPIQEVVPTKAQELEPMELSDYIRKMAMEIEGSSCVALAEITDIRVGWMRVFMTAGEKSFWVNLGIAPKKKKMLRAFMEECAPEMGGEYTKPSICVGEPIESMSCEESCDTPCESPCDTPCDDKCKEDSKSGMFAGKGRMAMACCVFLVCAIGFAGKSDPVEKMQEVKVSTSEIDSMFDEAQMLMKKANQALEESGEKMAMAERLKMKSTKLFSDMKMKMKSGESKAKLREMAIQVREWDNQEKKMRKEACMQSTQSKDWALTAQRMSMKANGMMLDILEEPVSRVKAQNSVNTAMQAIKDIQGTTREGFEGCVSS